MILNRDLLIGILLALLVAGAVGGFNYWKKYEEKRLDRLAEMVYLYEKGELKREEVEQKVKGTPYYPYFLAITSGETSQMLDSVEDPDVKKLFIEKASFLLYSKKKYEEALGKLSHIGKEDFNYPSATLLRAFIYEAKGDKEGALKLYKELIKDYPDTYFARISRAQLYSLEGN
ncbi:putative negative regulator of RcsB-dependent stress response [Hydrogenivirga caldilitoris]|uniref:Putative negative regulator of RcsB-dependent stress response n=1 Tax=Hydrogenivirga caldilitoris TaxID=246264 RepID=A0A497XNN5_9AQUI|nr:tetratricopeptide repeat protein [Hydrogenivirga caldilitoris]RLJ69914.1 putative negative regulator of RcsB-dependent stress response [Hydrogenivirga caldilitoris]